VPEAADNISSELAAWSREQLNIAIDELIRAGELDGVLLEARPAWAFPRSTVIGKVREQGEHDLFYWVICGDPPVDYINATMAATPREAARHFAMKWQLEAARHREPQVRKKLDPEGKRDWDTLCDALETRALSLFRLVDADSLWNRDVNR
jgi:hypothetical protein